MYRNPNGSATQRLVFGGDGDVYRFSSPTSASTQLHSATNWVRPESEADEFEFRYRIASASTGRTPTGTLTAQGIAYNTWGSAFPNDIVFIRILTAAQVRATAFVDWVLTVEVRRKGTTAILATGTYSWTKP